MKDYGEHDSFCYFHPKEAIVGICALCLKERLLILAAKQGHVPQPKDTQRTFRVLRRKPTITLPKVFARSSFLHGLDSRHLKPDYECDEGSIASLEDSFISIKFEDNGQATWDSKKAASIEPSSNPMAAPLLERRARGRRVWWSTQSRPR